jgi:hypothetical protein
MSDLLTATILPEDDGIEPAFHAEVVLETPSPLADVEAKPAPTLITEQEVLLGTAVALRPPSTRWWTRLGLASRRMFVTTAADQRPERPERRHYPRQYDFIADARMAREMDRL